MPSYFFAFQVENDGPSARGAHVKGCYVVWHIFHLLANSDFTID
jgi:hypothetical protein